MSDATTDLLAIVDGLAPAARVLDDGEHVAFLAPQPVRPGHVIVALDLDAAAHARLWAVVHGIGCRMRERLPCARVCVSVIGWAARQAHVHLIPTDAAGQVPGLSGAPLSAEQEAELLRRLR
jgi:histidine triad (HIT) family protein